MKIPLTISTRQFAIAVTFLTLAGFALTYYGVEYLIVLGIQASLLFNALIPHLPTTIRFRT